MESIEQIIKLVKMLNKDVNDEVLRVQTTILVRKCMNYMNRHDFPTELIEVVAEQLALNNNLSNVKRVTEGDTTIEYATVTDNTFSSLKTQLNTFRKVGTI